MFILDVDCGTLMPIIRLIRDGVIPLIQYCIPVVLIVLGILDIGKAVIASKEDEIKSAQKLFIKRCIYAVAIFFVPFIVQIVFGLIDNSGEQLGQSNWQTCWKQK